MELKKRLLLTGALRCDSDRLLFLENLGWNITYMPDERKEADFDVSVFEAVVCNGLFLYNDIKKFTSLKKIQLTSAGYDRVPLDYIKEKGISINNARGVYSAPMAETVICGVLQLYKHSRRFSSLQKEHKWQKDRELLELTDKRVCIIGAGSIGLECAKRFKAFGCEVTGIDPFDVRSEHLDHCYKNSEMPDVLSETDIVILTLPLTESTKGMFGKAEFKALKDGAIFANICRGGVVNEKELISALDSGKLYGAVLDVFESEPLDPSSPLWDMENVIITPHNSFVSDKTNERMFKVISDFLK